MPVPRWKNESGTEIRNRHHVPPGFRKGELLIHRLVEEGEACQQKAGSHGRREPELPPPVVIVM
jgi:hypothetical protein